MEVQHGIDLDGHVVFGDHILLCKIEDLFAQINGCPFGGYYVLNATDICFFVAPEDRAGSVHHGDDEVNTASQSAFVGAKAFNHHGFLLFYNFNTADDSGNDHEGKNCGYCSSKHTAEHWSNNIFHNFRGFH